MTVYYVYTDKDTKDPNAQVYLVPDPVLYAKTNYNPALHKFTGARIDANSPGEALKAYANPGAAKCEIAFVDEPEATAKAPQKRDVAQIKRELQGTFEDVCLRKLDELHHNVELVFKALVGLHLQLRPETTETKKQLLQNLRLKFAKAIIRGRGDEGQSNTDITA
jgi:hypothetical protein